MAKPITPLAALVFSILAASSVPAAEIVDVDVAEHRACALYDDGAVYCWGRFPGDDDDRSLPMMAKQVEDLPSAVSIAVGRPGACAIDKEDQLWCWGADLQRTFRAETGVFSMTPFRVEGLPNVTAVDIGWFHICVISTFSEVWCWGSNSLGELGLGDTEERGEPSKVPHLRNATSMSAGISNTCAVVFDGQLSCWGSDNPTRPGHPILYESNEPMLFDVDAFGRFEAVANGRNFACGMRSSGKVACWGSNIMGQLGTNQLEIGSGARGLGEVEGITNAIDLDASYFSACAAETGRVICWGQPDFVEFDSSRTLLPVEVPDLRNSSRVAIGTAFGCAINGGKVLCWGPKTKSGTDVIENMRLNNPAPVPGLP